MAVQAIPNGEENLKQLAITANSTTRKRTKKIEIDLTMRFVIVLCCFAAGTAVWARRSSGRKQRPTTDDQNAPTLPPSDPDRSTTPQGPRPTSTTGPNNVTGPDDNLITDPAIAEELVRKAFRYAVKEVASRRGKNRLLKNLGIDGKQTKIDMYNTRKDKGHSDVVIDLGEIVLEATKQLANLTDVFDSYALQLEPLIMASAAQELCPKGYPVRDCSKASNKYSSIHGRCNNKLYPERGSALSTQPRFLPNAYEDSLDSIRTSVSGDPLPSPRAVSNAVFFDELNPETPGEGYNTLMSMFWGQFLDHDIVLTPVITGEDHKSITCCIDDVPELSRPECLPIDIPNNDPAYTKQCMPFVRSAAAPQQDACTLGGKEVLNELTSYIDASNVYGSSNSQSRQLRNLTLGLMDMNYDELLPEDMSGNAVCSLSSDDDYCQTAGDVRVNVVPGLGGLHLLFVREHQRIVTELKAIRPKWKDNRLFLEARKIVGALMQQITYGEYLPLVFGPEMMAKYNLELQSDGFNIDYDPEVDASIRNAFGAAAFRFGHSQISDELAYLMSDWSTISMATPMENTLLDPHLLVTNGGHNVANLTRFIISEESKRVDRFFESSIRDKLFGGLDLPSLNIQRGRDHGLPSWVAYRSYCELPSPTSFDDLENMLLMSPGAVGRLRQVYTSVEDIDLFVGGMAETRLPQSYVGETFSCLLGQQFAALRFGDRFWYEREGPEGFTAEQLSEIRKVKLSKILCNNFGIEESQPDVFNQDSMPGNSRVKCDQLPDMSFDPWD